VGGKVTGRESFNELYINALQVNSPWEGGVGGSIHESIGICPFHPSIHPHHTIPDGVLLGYN
jgi:hypothetical protein